MTYYLLGKTGKITPPTAPISPVAGTSTMEPVAEEDESNESPTSKSDEKTVIECSVICQSEEDVFSAAADGATSTTHPLIVDNNSSRDVSENTLLLNGNES